MPLVPATYDPSLTGSTASGHEGAIPRPWPSRLTGSHRTRAAAAAATVALGAAAITYALRATDQSRTTSAAATLPYQPRELIVGYRGAAKTLLSEVRRVAHLAVALSTHPELTPNEQLLRLPNGTSPPRAAAEVAHLRGVAYAVPDYIARTAGNFYPDDPGRNGQIHGWEKVQWNFMPRNGVNAPEAWANLLADGHPGARGVVVAVVDTGVAFRNWKNFKRSPDFAGTRFKAPCDLVLGHIRNGLCTNPYPLDRESHGTFVAGEIAEATNNNYGLTGLAYQSTLMPVRVLDAEGNGDSSTIAAGIRYAVLHGAQVINLSIEFSPGTTSGQIPDVVSAINYAHRNGVVVVGAAGNDEGSRLDYPAAIPAVISVGATTQDRCLAIYSDVGKGLDLVAPGGGDDAASVPGSQCHALRNLPDVYQMTFSSSQNPSAFGLPGNWFGTSMAAPAVSAAAAMVIASGVLGSHHPTPAAVLARLEATAKPLGQTQPNNAYGYGLLDIGAATSVGGPLVPPSQPYTLASSAGVVR